MTIKSSKVEKHSFHIALIIIFILALMSVILGFLAQKNLFLENLDKFFYLKIVTGPHPKFMDFLLYPINTNFLKLPYNIPNYLYFINIIFLLYMFFYKRPLFKYALFCVFFGTALTLLTAALDWKLVFRQRPFLTLPTTLPLSETNIIKLFSSYPSGHARETMLYATIFGSFIPEIKIFMYLFAFFIAFSRVYIGAHYPIDVIAGLLIGYLAGKATLIISRDLQIILENRKGVPHGDKPKQKSK